MATQLGCLSQPFTALLKLHCTQNFKKLCKVHELNAAQIEKNGGHVHGIFIYV